MTKTDLAQLTEVLSNAIADAIMKVEQSRTASNALTELAYRVQKIEEGLGTLKDRSALGQALLKAKK